MYKFIKYASILVAHSNEKCEHILEREEIFQKVAGVLCEALNAEEYELVPTARLIKDLWAETIDFLDIEFRLERELGIKIPRMELFPEDLVEDCGIKAFGGDPEFTENHKLMPKALAQLAEKMPWLDLAEFKENPALSAIEDLFTVDAICRYIEWKLAK